MKPVIVAMVFLLALIFLKDPIVEQVKKTSRGKIVGPDAACASGETVATDGAALARQAGLEKSVYALARMLASENPNDTDAVKIAIAWAAKNEARARGLSAFDLLTRSKVAPGHFGAQNTGRYASTRNPPRQAEVDIALRVMGGEVADPTGGARRYFTPKTQDALFAKGAAGYKKDAEAVRTAWREDGFVAVAVPGVDSNELQFFRKVT